MDVAPNRAFPDLALRHLALDPLPNSVRRVALLPRRFLVVLQNLIDECYRHSQFPAGPLHLLSWRWQGTANRLSYHAPMYVQLLGDSGNRTDAKLVLSADLLEKLHLCSPIQ